LPDIAYVTKTTATVTQINPTVSTCSIYKCRNQANKNIKNPWQTYDFMRTPDSENEKDRSPKCRKQVGLWRVAEIPSQKDKGSGSSPEGVRVK